MAPASIKWAGLSANVLQVRCSFPAWNRLAKWRDFGRFCGAEMRRGHQRVSVESLLQSWHFGLCPTGQRLSLQLQGRIYGATL